MSDVILIPAFHSDVADSGSQTRFGPDAWNAPRLFSAGVNGDVLVRDTVSATGASWRSGAWLDVRIYGTNGAAIQAAAALVNAAGGGVVFLPPGVYPISTAIGIPSNVTIQGAGMGVTILRPAAGTLINYNANGQSWGAPLVAAGVNHIAIRDLTIDLATSGNLNNGIELGYDGAFVETSDATVERVEVLGNPGVHAYMIWVRRANRVKVLNCWVNGNDPTPGDPGVDHSGIEVFGGTDVLVSGCTVRNLDGTGLAIFTNWANSTTDNVRFIGNTVDNVTDGIYFSASYVGGVSQSVTNSAAIGNTVTRCASRGLAITAPSGAIVQDVKWNANTVTDCATPVWFFGDAGSIWRVVSVQGNTIERGTGTVGAMRMNRVSGVTCTSNTILTTTGIGIRLDSVTDSVFSNNSIDGAADNGILVSSCSRCSVDGNYIANWDVSGGTDPGILVTGGAECSLSLNRFYRSVANHPRGIDITSGDAHHLTDNRLLYTTTNTNPFPNSGTNPNKGLVVPGVGVSSVAVANTRVTALSHVLVTQTAGTFKLQGISIGAGTFTINFSTTSSGSENFRWEIRQ